jgi:hypothetical protein
MQSLASRCAGNFIYEYYNLDTSEGWPLSAVETEQTGTYGQFLDWFVGLVALVQDSFSCLGYSSFSATHLFLTGHYFTSFVLIACLLISVPGLDAYYIELHDHDLLLFTLGISNIPHLPWLKVP